MSKKKKPIPRKTEKPKPRPASHAPAPAWTHLFKKPSVRVGAILLVIILAAGVRFAFLGADPPLDVSWSHDLYTDPPQYTSYARNAIIFGDWNPLNDDRLVFFLKNITGVVAYLVFLVIGPSVSAGQVVAILLNLLAIGALAWAVGRAFGFAAGWTSALLLSISYLFVNYGRMPFLEVATNGCLAFTLLALIASERHWWLAIVAGVVAGIGTFFGKMTSLHAIPIFFLTAGLIGWQVQSESKGTRWGRPIGFAAGFVVVLLSWYVYAYAPASAEVLAYLKEQSLSLYGTPVGLTSISGFFSQWFSFGLSTGILTWGTALSALGLLGMAAFAVRYVTAGSIRSILSRMPPAGFALIGWFWSAWAAFMPFNYRPVRYQIVLLFPLAACAGWLVAELARVVSERSRKDSPATSWYALPFITLFLGTGIQHLILTPLFVQTGDMTIKSSVFLALFLGLIVASVWVALARRPPQGERSLSPSWARYFEITVGLVLLVMIINQLRYFEGWWSTRRYTIADANRDLELILNDGAVLTGGWGTPLTQDDRLGNFPAMFGVSKPDLEFFREYPITHAAEVDQKDMQFYKNYPDIVANSARVTTYFIRNMPIAIYRVAEAGGNPQAATYQPSPFEKMRARCEGLDRDSLLLFLPRWVADSADHYSGWRWLGDVYYRSGTLDSALACYHRAVDDMAGDFSLWALIGDLSWEIFRGGSSAEYRQQAIAAWNRAMQLSPDNPQLAQRLRRAYGR